MKTYNNKLVKLIFLLIISGGVFYFESSGAWAATYYVDKDSRGGSCSDSKAGTITQPWCTIGKANSTLQAGDTVYIRQGTYSEQIKPASNGLSGNYITYRRYQNESVTFKTSSHGADLSGKKYINLDGLRFIDSGGSWVKMESAASYNIVQNCYGENSDAWAGIDLAPAVGSPSSEDPHHNKILNNVFKGVCNHSGPENCADCGGPADLIAVQYGHHNIFEGNYFEYAPHNLLEFQSDSGSGRSTRNVIRNNIFNNRVHTSLNIYTNSNDNLIEGNIILNSGEEHLDNWCTGSSKDRTKENYKHSSIQLGSGGCVIRNNVMVNNGTFSIGSIVEDTQIGSSIDNRIYNNTSFKEVRGWNTTCTLPVDGNAFKNNVVYDSDEYLVRFDDGSSSSSNLYVNNNLLGASLVYQGCTGNTVSDIQSCYPNQWIGNLGVDPKFVNAPTKTLYSPTDFDLHLQSGSPMIDAGMHLTSITSNSGSGTTFTVADVSYFYDGWGIPGETGDVIKTQNGQTATITGINYDTNTITVNSSISWTKNEGISLGYSGSKPDMGAYEYGGETPPSSCTENWSCMEWSGWSECINNQQSHTRVCTDLNNCGTTVNKPIENESQVCSSEGTNAKEFALVQDTLISSGYPGYTSYADYNYGNLDTFYIGARQNGSKDRVLLKFPNLISSGNIPEGSVITSATLTLTNTGSQGYTTGYEIKARRVLESWSEGDNLSTQSDAGETSWSWRLYNTNRWSSDTDNNGGDNAGCGASQSHTTQNEVNYVYSASPGDGNQINMDVTGIVQEWAISGENANHGFILLAPAIEGGTGSYIRFASSENANASYRPKLTVVLGSAVEPTSYGLSDFVNLMTDWLKTAIGSPADVNNDGKVNSRDLGIMMHGWGG